MDLQQQAHQLQRQMTNREKRRAQQAHRDEDHVNDDSKPRKKRAEPLKVAQQAYAAVMAAAALAPQPVQRCELCQAAFITEAQLQQHLDGPVHKKAMEKAAREAAKQQHINQHSAVAQEALAAAAWAAGEKIRGHTAPQHHQRQTQHQPQQQTRQQQPSKGRPQGTCQRGQPQGAARPIEQLTHQQMLEAAKQDSAPLSLDGWVPPSVTAAAPPAQQQHRQLSTTEQQRHPGHEEEHSQQKPRAATRDKGQDAGEAQHAEDGAANPCLPCIAPRPGEASDADTGGGGAAAGGENSSSSTDSDDDEDDVPRTFESFF